MAILKHIASKNMKYYDSVKYLIYQHDEFTNKPILDEYGLLIERENMLIDSVNVSCVDLFPIECLTLNDSFNQNKKRSDIKSHHYIISFDPKDVTDNNLTIEKAQSIGMEFCKTNFPGHQALVATHADGHNHSGNIHIHIVINSVRKYDIEKTPFAERASDLKAGCKHHVTKKLLRYLKSSVMDICQTNGLYQVDLLSPARVKITEKEYWLKRRHIEEGDTNYKSDLDFLREKIYLTMNNSKSFKEFKDTLFFEYGITVHESRGRLSYLSPDKSKPVTARRLGTDFDYYYVIEKLASNNVKAYSFESKSLKGLIDIDNNPKAKNSISYARALRLINIQTTATTAAIISKEKISSSKQLEDNLKVKMDKYNELSTKYQEVNRKIKLLNAQIRATGQYWAYKDIYAKYMAHPKAKKEAFFEQHRAELTLYLAASSELKKLTNGHAKLPTVKMLRSQVAELKVTKNKLYEAQSAAKKDYIYAQTLLSNVKGKSIEKHNTKKHSIDDD